MRNRYWLCFPVLLCASPIASARDLPVITINKAPAERVIPDEAAAKEAMAQIAGGSNVVSQTEWKDQRASTVNDMFDYAPGVFVQPRNGAEASRISIRGSGLSRQFQGGGLLVLQDGIPINTADGSFDFQEIDPWLVDYTEIYRGANALSYGAGTLGGATNFITPTAETAPANLLRLEGGSFGTAHGQIATARKWQNQDIYLTATGFSSDGFRGQNTQHTGRLSANTGWQISPTAETRFYIGHTHTQAEIPGTLTKAQAYADPSRGKAINTSKDYARDLEITRLANKTAWRTGKTRYESTLYARFRELANPSFTYISSDTQDFGWRGSFTTPQGARGTWTGGINLAYGSGKEDRYTNNGGEMGALAITRYQEAQTHEAYVQYGYLLQENLTAIASIQGSYATRRIEQQFPNNAIQEKDYTGFNPRVGLLYDIAPDIQLFSNLSRSFEPPELVDLSGGNDPAFKQLDAQTATTIEIGSRGKWQQTGWDAAYYHARVKNELIRFQFPNGDSDMINAGNSTHDGIELGLSNRLAQHLYLTDDSFHLRLAYQWNHFRLNNNSTLENKDLPGIPQHFIKAELTYTHPQGWNIGPNLEWVPEAPPIDLANSYHAQRYFLLGARASYQPENKPYSFYLEGRNLLNKTYIATYDVIPNANSKDSASFYTGDGRAIYAGMRCEL